MFQDPNQRSTSLWNLSRLLQAELITLSSAISQLTYAFIKQLFIEFSREYTRHSGERNGYLDGYFTVSVLE